jgi:hypothetical protein
MRGALLAAACALGWAAAAHANDSVAVTAAGGLELRQSRDIDMVSEDLYVSTLEVRVRYVFRNRSRRAVRTIVAFPMPPRDLANEEGEIAWPSDFRTRVAGRDVAMRVERRATLAGVDHTALLTRLGVPILGRDSDSAMHAAFDALPRAAQDRLAESGLAEFFSEPGTTRRNGRPLWTVKETWYWQQSFPAGRNLIVEHRYRPGAGGTVATALASPGYRASHDGRAQIGLYCIDGGLLGAVDRIARRAGSRYPTISETWLRYLLTTGANWRSPIGDFRLVVDKGRPENLVSFCGQGVRRIGPTRFEMRRRNWRPDRDLDVLILQVLQ